MSKKEVESLFKTGRTVHGPLFYIIYSTGQQNSQQKNKFACIVPNKAGKLASARNFLRRRMYLAVEVNQNLIKSNTHMVILAKSALKDLFKDKSSRLLAKKMFVENLTTLLLKAGLLNSK